MAILGSEAFDVAVAVDSLLFGPAGVFATSSRISDIDRDGYTDLVVSFDVIESGLGATDTQAFLTSTAAGTIFSATNEPDKFSGGCTSSIDGRAAT